LERLALADLAVANKTKGPKASPEPAWSTTLNAFLHYDLKRLTAICEKDDTAYNRFFQFLAIQEPNAEAARKDFTPVECANAAFFLGWFLSNRGEKDCAGELLKQCAEAENRDGRLKTHSLVLIAKLKKEK
jgi:hypothetical protein